jgi:prepilin-type N-terminal cleavage/methylation domain-containing protein
MRRLGASQRSKQGGFTLLEVAVVLSIIAILAVLLTPTVANMLDKAALSAALNDAKAIKTALDMYFDDHSKQYPATSDMDTYSEMQSVLSDYLALPDSNKANFTFANLGYCRGGNPTFDDTNGTVSCGGTDKKKFAMIIKAKNSDSTPIHIQHTGVTY